MKPRNRNIYVYVVLTTTFHYPEGVEYSRTPSIIDYDLYRSFEEAKESILNDFDYWCETLNPSKTNIQIAEPSRGNAGDYYLDLGGYRVDCLDREGKPRARVGNLYRFRL